MSGIELIGLSILAIILFIIGIPILLVFGIWVLGFHLIFPSFTLSNIAIVAFEETQSFPWVAVPLFVVTGDLIYESGVAEDIISWSRSAIGWLPGSSGNAAVLTSSIFSAITGSNAATTAAVGKALFPVLENEGYDGDYAAATIATGGTLGGMIPPSILLIIYGITFSVSIPKLFIGGILPGLLMAVVIIGVNTIISYKRDYGARREYQFSIFTIIKRSWKAFIGFSTVAILFGGIFGGIFTPTEASAVAVAYLILSAILSGRIRKFSNIKSAFLTGTTIMGIIVPVIVFSRLIQQQLVLLGLLDAVSGFIISLQNPLLIGGVMILIMLITGSLLASVPNLVLTAPLLAPVAANLGISTLQWGIIFMISDMIGFITPPYGLNLFIISGIADIDYILIAKQALPYLISLILVLILFFAFPEANFLIS